MPGIVDRSAEMTIDLGEKKVFASIFINNRCFSNISIQKFGTSELRIGNDGTKWSLDENVILVIPNIYDGGYFNFQL